MFLRFMFSAFNYYIINISHILWVTVKMRNKHKISLIKSSFSNLLSMFRSYKFCSPLNKTERQKYCLWSFNVNKIIFCIIVVKLQWWSPLKIEGPFFFSYFMFRKIMSIKGKWRSLVEFMVADKPQFLCFLLSWEPQFEPISTNVNHFC